MIIYFPNHEIQRSTSWDDILWDIISSIEMTTHRFFFIIGSARSRMFMSWILSFDCLLEPPKLLTDCIGSKRCETHPKRIQATHSRGKITGGARTKPWKINCILFRFGIEFRQIFKWKKERLKSSKMITWKNIRLRALPMMVKKRWVVISFKHNWLQCVSSTDFSSQNIVPGCVSLYFVIQEIKCVPELMAYP